MGNFFLHNNLIKAYGKDYANEIRNCKYNLIRHYGLSCEIARRFRLCSWNHILQMINSQFTDDKPFGL
jgi:hypothetical protein